MGTNKIDFTELAIALAQTLEEKNRAYGNSYDESIKVHTLLLLIIS